MMPILNQQLKLLPKGLVFLLSLALIFHFGCSQKKTSETNSEISEIYITPVPSKILYKRGLFYLDKSTRILLNLSDDKSKNAGEYFISQIVKKTNLKLKIADKYTTTKIRSGIEIILGQQNNIPPQGFNISITGTRIKIAANDEIGIFYATNVIIELLKESEKGWNAAQVSINDYPNTSVRGLYLAFQDSIKNKADFIELLKNNRINFLIISDKWNFISDYTLKIEYYSIPEKNWGQSLVDKKSIKKFYLDENHPKDKIIFTINNLALLHPDSLSILGEAMWSKPSKLNYNKLLNNLNGNPIYLKN